MKKIGITLAVSAILLSANVLAQENYMPFLLKESLKRNAAQLKSGIVGSYPQHTEEFNWATDWVAYRTIETSYETFGEPKAIEYNQNGNRTRDLYSYNGDNKVTEVIHQSMTGGVWVNQTRQVTAYNNLGYASESRYEQWNGTSWDLASGSQTTYEMDGNRIMIMTTKDWKTDTSTWVNSTRETYTYTGAGIFYSTVITDTWDNAWVPTIKMEFTWNGNMIAESLDYNYQDNAWNLQGKTVYEFQSNNSMIMTSYTYLGPDNWMGSFRITLTNDSHGNTTLNQMEMYTTAWTVLSATRYQLTYAGNNLTQRIRQTAAGPIWNNTLKEVFSNFASMSTDITLLPDTGLSVFPNPAGKQASVRLSLLKAGSVTLSVFSMTGQKILEETITANGSDVNYLLNLKGVRPGSYILIARDKQGVEVGKTRFIKDKE